MLTRFFVNIYRNDAALFVAGEVIYSTKGTAGRPNMAMFAIAVRPLVARLTINQSIQVWFADNATGKIGARRK